MTDPYDFDIDVWGPEIEGTIQIRPGIYVAKVSNAIEMFFNEYSPEGYPNPRKYPKQAKLLAQQAQKRLKEQERLAEKGKSLLKRLAKTLGSVFKE